MNLHGIIAAMTDERVIGELFQRREQSDPGRAQPRAHDVRSLASAEKPAWRRLCGKPAEQAQQRAIDVAAL
jgi:hypothetical protein